MIVQQCVLVYTITYHHTSHDIIDDPFGWAACYKLHADVISQARFDLVPT